MTTRPLQFVRRGQTVTLHKVPPDRTLLEVLREDLHCTDTKEGCNEGDCGACTVVLGEAENGRMKYRAVNSCIRLAHSVQGKHCGPRRTCWRQTAACTRCSRPWCSAMAANAAFAHPAL